MARSYEKPAYSSIDDNEKHREFDRDIREMVSTLTSRLGLLRKGGSAAQNHELVDDQGSSVITLAGTNTGATMRAELNGKTMTKLDQDTGVDESESLTSYINSNFQAINNSIMFGGSYTGNDPGVHMEYTSDLHEEGHKAEKGGAKGKKIGKDNAESGGSWFSKE
ncbi:uncharacterized protein E5676_scaffold21G004650 [Cucumis melo var. makuwa]|uniref:Uncharacterized protein LOC103493165 n=2 Tax=Cucumis melo TaxID=3656 RepID=A0A1S3BSV6_CUCME|nr:uncharacterized protein LOC103493165 [Cucumis melo]KAA0044827.1 uncharacterized protein E6C27_scaffold74G001190 [Cucumis melo var. makuwa]TYK16637.1 uncharacterized protein E5676_scaffold21G004650 [Cucumis melo var. makuwa]